MKVKKIKKKFHYNLDKVVYGYAKYKWAFDLRRYYQDFEHIQIKKPIFLLGVQGGGLTLISRMIRRNRNIVSPTGNYMYWAGADEMSSVFGRILPQEFIAPKYHKSTKELERDPGGWFYASDQYLDIFKNDENDVTPILSSKFKKLIRWSIRSYALDINNARFIDKSQIFTIKVPFINEICKEYEPKFILITRNPYAMCYRAVTKNSEYAEYLKNNEILKALDIASQHWNNTMKLALDAQDKVANFMHIQFETVLNKPEGSLKKICDFIEIDFDNKMIPSSKGEFPVGSLRKKRWYPLRTDINRKYLSKLDKSMFDVIDKRCHHLVDYFGYQAP